MPRFVIPDSTGLESAALTEDNSSFFRIGQYDEAEEGDRSPSHMDESAAGILVQTTGGLFFLIGEDAYQEYDSDLDIYIKQNLTETIDEDRTTYIYGSDTLTSEKARKHLAKSHVILASSPGSLDDTSTSDYHILLQSDEKIKLTGDTGVKMNVGSHYAEIDSDGHWNSQFKNQIDITEGTSHSRYEGWTTDEYYGGSFSLEIATAIGISASVSIDISLGMSISVENTSIGATLLSIGATNTDISTTNTSIGVTNTDFSTTLNEVKVNGGAYVETKDVEATANMIKIASGMNIYS